MSGNMVSGQLGLTGGHVGYTKAGAVLGATLHIVDRWEPGVGMVAMCNDKAALISAHPVGGIDLDTVDGMCPGCVSDAAIWWQLDSEYGLSDG